jgi:hypothetical protein
MWFPAGASGASSSGELVGTDRASRSGRYPVTAGDGQHAGEVLAVQPGAQRAVVPETSSAAPLSALESRLDLSSPQPLLAER